ncbi:hypothetical protein [Bradyrhizobium pachyrhizi]|uniref:hypothetical protein n=1 Tax=Bradyrhizobium pachyrhizi TaxID=280333 RepID=UPI003D35FD7E
MLVDITSRKQAEERMMLLTHKVDHRANNLPAVIQASCVWPKRRPPMNSGRPFTVASPR